MSNPDDGASSAKKNNSISPVTGIAIVAACFLVWGFWTFNKPAAPATVVVTPQQQLAVRNHNYDLKDGVDYGYTALVTDEQRKAGQAGAAILMVSYAGEREGKHQVHQRQAGMITAYECAAPCDIVKVMSAMDIDGLRGTVNVERLRSAPNMIAAMALQDAMTGKLQAYSEYPENAAKGTALKVWIDERKGILRTVQKK